MPSIRPLRAALVASAFATAVPVIAADTPAFAADPPKQCEQCTEWNAPIEPFRLFGNTWYVGVSGLSAVLIASDDGLILLDGALPQSAPLIAANIRQLGYRVEDVKIIATSHAHYDHVGGVAALARASGAQVVASAATAAALRAGGPTPDDPQYAFGAEENAFPPVASVRVVADGETVSVGKLAITAHYTPGHTPGATAWTWRACDAGTCRDIVYADSLNAYSHDSYRFSGGDGKPGIADSFRRSIATVAALPCDIIISVHPGATELDAKLAARKSGKQPDPFVDPAGCKHYAEAASKKLEPRIAKELAAER